MYVQFRVDGFFFFFSYINKNIIKLPFLRQNLQICIKNIKNHLQHTVISLTKYLICQNNENNCKRDNKPQHVVIKCCYLKHISL